MLPFVLSAFAVEVARTALPALVVGGGLLASGWLVGRSKLAAGLVATGALLVLAGFLTTVVAMPLLQYLVVSITISGGPAPFRLAAILGNGLEGLGLVVMVLGAAVGPAPAEDDG